MVPSWLEIGTKVLLQGSLKLTSTSPKPAARTSATPASRPHFARHRPSRHTVFVIRPSASVRGGGGTVAADPSIACLAAGGWRDARELCLPSGLADEGRCTSLLPRSRRHLPAGCRWRAGSAGPPCRDARAGLRAIVQPGTCSQGDRLPARKREPAAIASGSQSPAPLPGLRRGGSRQGVGSALSPDHLA